MNRSFMSVIDNEFYQLVRSKENRMSSTIRYRRVRYSSADAEQATGINKWPKRENRILRGYALLVRKRAKLGREKFLLNAV